MSGRERKVVRESISLYDAKTNLSSLVDRASNGEEIVIMKFGRPKARLMPMEERTARLSGLGKGAWQVASDFDAPLPDDLLDAFEGNA